MYNISSDIPPTYTNQLWSEITFVSSSRLVEPYRYGIWTKLQWKDEYGNDVEIWSPLTASDGSHNTGYIEKKSVYNAIGDTELISSSLKQYDIGITSGNGVQFVPAWEGPIINYSDPNTFRNRLIIDENKGFKHKPYIALRGAGVNFDHEIDGRPVGRTAYFVTSSGGEIVYPSNHYINFPTSKESPVMSKLFYEGVKWSSGSHHAHDPKFQDPFPEVPFYSVDVQGSDTERQLIVRRNKK